MHMPAFTHQRPVYGVPLSPQRSSLILGLLLALVMSWLGIRFTGLYLAVSSASLNLIWVSQNIAVINVPLPSDVYANHHGLYLSTLAKDGGLSLIIMSDNLTAQMWERTGQASFAHIRAVSKVQNNT